MRGPARRRLGALSGLGALALLAQACASAGYTWHALAGGARLLLARRPIDAVLADPRTPPALAERLRLVETILAFAAEELALPADESFRHYADLGRPAAVWTVVAAPELSVEPLTWCFPVAGCVPYRGYFHEEAARRFAQRLRSRGHDVTVGPVTAYSTLGWFADPVLSTYVLSAEEDLAGLLFHELAHQVVYVRDDSELNESFATTVERVGVERWLASREDAAGLAAYEERRRHSDELAELALAARDRLGELYASPLEPDAKRAEKARLLADLVAESAVRRSAWGESGPDPWLGPSPNNADLAALGAYHRLVPAFESLLAEQDSLPAFYQAARELAQAPAAERRARLAPAGLTR
jgi:predicted aminopeptidase